ncbi:MAG: SLBB domain-containing protein [Proteobacteria bacterium]|nr:SLBB domain-containing protein [Pseudomonadota bacterium]
MTIARHILVTALLLATATVFAQNIQLSPAQQQMLSQLPLAQRQQAMDALRQLQSQQPASGQQSINEPVSRLSPSLPDAAIEQIILNVEPRAESRSRLVLNFELSESIPSAQRRELERDVALQKLIGSHLFVLDDSGVLSLQGLEPIPLLGLNEADINKRLEAEPYLSVFDINARILGQQLVGIDALEPFGYDVFEPRDASFDPPSSGPVPPDYVLGPGDTIRVQLFGNVNGIYEYEVTRDGILNLPEIGPVTVTGIPFSEFRADINRRVKEMLIGTQVSVTMGQLRTIRIFVLGDANRPGSYVVSGLATISSALYRSGGISRVGSLRDIQLKRSGRVVARLDLYDLLLNGDTSGDSRLQPGDVIFIPPIGTQVSVAGAVKRPAIYETKGKSSILDVIQMAGGLLPDAYPDGARIERIDANKNRVTISIDADSQATANTHVRPGDVLVIPQVLPQLEYTVTLTGHVHRPGPYQWREGMRLTDLLGTALELKPGADSDYVMLRREDPKNRNVYVQSTNLNTALENPESAENIRLQPRDTVYVFSLAYGRQRVIEPILDELKLQARIGEPFLEVSVSGQVRSPGSYPLEQNMRISDLVRAGGSLSEQAYALEAELVRYETGDDEYRDAEVIDVDLGAILRGDTAADLVLQEHDNLRISAIPQWNSILSVRLEGEVKFPGTYRIRRGESLRQVLERAGGLTEEAFPEGAIFLREALRVREQEQREVLARRLEADLTTLSLQTADMAGSETLAAGKMLLAQLRSTEAVGRLVIDIDQLVNGVELRDGDRLLVPKQSQEVTVIGETQQNASHLYQSGLSRKDYIEMSGGVTRRADKKYIYVVRASGAVVAGNQSRWFSRGSRTEIRAGDTIVVPLEVDRIRPLTFWTNVTQILYQGAIAVAAIKTFDN